MDAEKLENKIKEAENAIQDSSEKLSELINKESLNSIDYI